MINKSLLLCLFIISAHIACARKNDENVDSEETPAAPESDIILKAFPSDQDSPVANPTKIGTPSYFRIQLPDQGQEIRYKDRISSLFSILPFAGDGQWINTDRDLTVKITPASSAIRILSGIDNTEISSVTIRRGNPSTNFQLQASSPGLTKVTFSSDETGTAGTIEFKVIVAMPTTVTNTVNPLPARESCTQTTYQFNGYFSLTQDTTISLAPAGCAFYADAACSSQVLTLKIPADRDTSEPIYYLSSGNGFVDMSDSKSGFAQRATCFAI